MDYQIIVFIILIMIKMDWLLTLQSVRVVQVKNMDYQLEVSYLIITMFNLLKLVTPLQVWLEVGNWVH